MATITSKVNVTTATGPSAENPHNLGNGDTYTVTTESYKAVSGGAVNIASGAYAEGTDLTFANCKAYSEDKPASGGAVANFGTLTFKGNTVAFSGNTVVAGAYSANGGALYNTGVVTFECEAFFTGNKKDGVPSYGDAVYNIGTITFEKNVTFSNNGATSVHNYGTINFAKTMTLATEKDWFTNDTINMSGIDYIGTLNWDISEATAVADSAKLVGWNYLYIATGSKLAITVDAEDQLTGSYVIAEGATTETTASFTLKNNTDSTTATIMVGGEAVEYNGRRYTLTQDTMAGTITLTAAAPVTYTLSFSPSSSATVSVGATSEVYTATVMGSDGIEYLIDDLSFDSEAPIATFNMKSNKTFTVTGESEGNNIPYTVTAWLNNGETVDATFDVTVEPLVSYTLTGSSSLGDQGGVTFTVDGIAGANSAYAGQTVELTPDEVAGYKCVNYTINGTTVTTETSFTMPAQNVTVQANYAELVYTLTLTPSSVNVSVGGTSDAVTAVVTDQDGNTYDIVNLQFDGGSPIAIFDTPTNDTFTVTGLEEGNANYTVIATIGDGSTMVSTPFNVEVTAAPVGNDFTICICADGLLHKNSAKGEEITDKAITDHLQMNADGIWEMTDLVFDTTAFRGIRLEDTNATITVNGVNSIIAGNGYDYTVVGIDFNDYNLALQGSGTLSVTTRDTTGNFSSALEAEEVGSLSIAGITLNAVSGNAGNSSAAIRVAGALLIQSGTVHAVAGAASNSAGIVVTGAQISDSVTVIAESASGGMGYMSYSAITTDGSTPATIYDAFGNELTWDGNQYTYVSGGTPASYITNVAAPVGNDFTICICADGLLHKNSVDGEEITDTAITDHLKINADGIWEMTGLVFDTTARYGIRLGDTNATITVDGTNSIIAGNGTENTHGFVFEDYSLALQGSGTLSVTARDTAANISIAFSSEKAGSLSINGITLNAVSGTAQEESVAIWAADTLLIQSGTVHAVSGTAKDYQAGIVVVKAGAQISDSATVIAESTSGKGYMSPYAITTDGSTPATIYDADGNTLTWDGSKYTYVSGGTPASYVTNVAAPVGNDFTICICADGLLHKNSVDGEEITDTAITDHLQINADGIWEMTDLVFDTTARYGIQLGNTDVTITVDGTNSIIAGNGEDMTCGIMFENYSLALHGSGTLSVTARETTDKVSSAFGAAEDAGSLLIDGITLNAVSGNAGQISYGIWAVDGLTIQSGTVHAVSGTATYSTGIAVTKVGAQISDSATVIAESTSGYGYMSPYAITTDGSTPATIYDASGNTLTWDGDQYTYVSGGTPASYITNHGTAPEPVLYTLTLDPSSVNLTVDGSDVVTTTVTDGAGTQYTITDLQFSKCDIANCVAAEDFNSFTVAALASGEESVTVTATLGNGETVDAKLALNVVPVPGAFYCSTWTEKQPINVTWHGKAFSGTVGDGTFFNDYSGAKTKVASNNDFIVVMESSTITSVQHYDAQNVYLSCDDAVYNRMILGGELISGSHEYTGDYTVNIEGGTYMREVAGGDASNKYVDRTGNITLNISGGVFVGHVLGGSYYSAKSVLGSAVVVGDINFTISGGVFEQRVYGGCGSMTEEISSRAAMGGNVYLTIDASANAISFGECVAAGNRGNGLLLGSTNVTVTGLGSNLTFADSSVLFGGCGGDYYSTDSGVRTAVTNVVDPATWEDPGVRALTFSNFTGDFNAEIRMFSDITFDDSTLMNFADANLDLKEIETWNFDCTSFASNLNKNQFTGDTINVDTTALTEGSWTLLSGSESAFADLGSAASVTLGGATATYSGTAWTTDNFSLSVEDQTMLVISKIA